jgi:hypothetical protein
MRCTARSRAAGSRGNVLHAWRYTPSQWVDRLCRAIPSLAVTYRRPSPRLSLQPQPAAVHANKAEQQRMLPLRCSHASYVRFVFHKEEKQPGQPACLHSYLPHTNC